VRIDGTPDVLTNFASSVGGAGDVRPLASAAPLLLPPDGGGGFPGGGFPGGGFPGAGFPGGGFPDGADIVSAARI